MDCVPPQTCSGIPTSFPSRLLLTHDCQTFISFSGIPLLEISRSEVRHLGISGFLLSGLLGWVLTEPFEIARGFVLDVGPEVILQFFTSGRHTAASLERYNVGARMLYHVYVPLQFFSRIMLNTDLGSTQLF